MTYSMTCAQGHEPETFTVEAESDEEAMGQMMAKTAAHNAEKHPDMTMTPEEARSFIMANWTKA